MFERFGWIGFSPHTKVEGFVAQLEQGKITGSRCTSCGCRAFPPRADCSACGSPSFELVPISGKGRVVTFTRIEQPPAGFEEHAPYTVGVVDLEEGGRLLAWFGSSIPAEEIGIGLAVQVVPRRLGDGEGARLVYELERPP
ncbi:MAG: Zn-ribbon domain-containing OB-fold protein, partial [Deltaproteobacteria bacterium]|nr:Zn-ribbon domain-containing OB-fold protein [Deltaproteobacteria bacterium]